MESVLLADFRENYHTVDMDAVEAGRASNQEGTPEWQQAQKDKVKLKAWNSTYFPLQIYMIFHRLTRFS